MATRELNLLPPTRRRQLARQLSINSVIRLIRSVIIGLMIITVVGLGTGITFHLLGMFLSGETTVELGQQVKRYQELRTQIAKENENLGFMATASADRVLWSALFADLYATMPPGTHVSSMIVESIPRHSISFSGVAVSRGALVVLEDRLKSLTWVESVEAPSANLLQRVNPLYTFRVLLKETKKEPDPPQESL